MGDLANQAVQACLALGGRIEAAIQHGQDLPTALATAGDALDATLSPEMIELALANADGASPVERGNKLGFQLLTTRLNSPISRLFGEVARRTCRRAGPALGPLLEPGDLISLLRWKLWTLPAVYFGPLRILKHPGLAAYLSVIARRIVVDECRAMERNPRIGIDAPSVEASVDPRATLESVLDELDLLQRFASELPSWQAPLVPILAGQLDRDEGLAALNHKRQDAGLALWSAEAMRTAIHRARRRLRVLMTSSIALQVPAAHTGTEPISRRTVSVTHDWRRFWSERDSVYSLDDSGFLVDPETEFGRHVHAAVALDRLVEMPCLILLGEPGIGKSTVVAQECQRLRDANEHISLIDLARIHHGETLRAHLRRGPSNSDKPFYLFFDGLDEGLGQNPNLISELSQLLHDAIDPSRVRVRIASRTLEWPAAFEDQLKQRWSGLRVYELLPLRRIDVISAANDQGTDGASFVTSVQERDATSLAIRPVSLRFLLAMYAADGTLPRSKVRLYDEGTLILCSEHAVLQHGGRRSNADAYRRRALAARLAVLATFTNRHVVARSDHGDGVLAIQVITDEIEVLADATYRIDLAAVEDVLAGTALFTARTATTYGWSHQSYREFLAAWYLAQHQVDVNGATALYFPSGANRVPTPLREVAAWHAAFAPSIFDLLIERDPEVLLHSDSGAVSEASRALLARALLDRMARFEALDRAYRYSDYRKLEHPALAEQVRPYILDRNANTIARCAAMEIAGACRLSAVVDALATVLFNRDDDSNAREIATGSLGQIGGEQARGTFLALLASGFDPDPDDIIRGSILTFLWPAHIDAAALFTHLTPPKRDNLFAAYQRFLHELPTTLAPDHLAIALHWAILIYDSADYELQDTIHDVIDIAVRSLDRTDVRTAVCRIVHGSLHNHLGAWYAGGARRHGTERSLSKAARRLIAEDLLRTTPDDEDLARGMVWFEPPLLEPEDIPWLADLANAAQSTTLVRACGRCVAALYESAGYPVDAETADAVVSVELAEFMEPLRPFLATIELGSEPARQLAERWARGQPRQISRRSPDEHKPEPPSPSIWSRSLPHLERAEENELASWIDFVLAWTEHSRYTLIDGPEWTTLEPANQSRIILTGLRFVNEFEAPDSSWLDQRGSYPSSTVAARFALHAIGASRPALLNAISEAAWRRWCPTLVAVPFPEIEPAIRRDLFRRCVRLPELSESILRVVRRQNADGSHVRVFSTLPDPLPEALHSVVLELLPELGDLPFEDGLSLLVRSGNRAAHKMAQAELQNGPAERSARSARVILPQDGASWTLAISRMQRDRDFIAALAPLVSFDEDMKTNPFTTLSERGGAELWLALIRQFPPEALPTAPSGLMHPMDHIQRLHRRMAGMLVGGGTAASVTALEWLVEQEPRRNHFRYLLVQARKKLTDNNWHPLSVDEFRDAMRSSILEDAPPRDQVRCTLSIRSGSDIRKIERIIAHVVRGTSTIGSSESLMFDIPPNEVSALLHAVENKPDLRAATLALRADTEWIFEAIPATSLAEPERRDVGRAKIDQLLQSVDVLIETATETETTALHAAMTPLPTDDALLVGSVDRVATYTIGLLGGYPVAHVQTDMGPEGPNAAPLATQDAIREVAPKLVLLIGIAFGMDRTRQRLGDVLVAQHVTGYEMVKLKPDTIEERGETLRGDVIMVERIKAHSRTWSKSRADGSQIAVHVGQVVSGAKLVNSREFRDSLQSRFPSALGGEMEGCGAYAAALRNRVPVMLVKAICDWADGLKNDHAQPFAAAAAVDLIRHVLDKPDVLHSLGIQTKPSPRP